VRFELDLDLAGDPPAARAAAAALERRLEQRADGALRVAVFERRKRFVDDLAADDLGAAVAGEGVAHARPPDAPRRRDRRRSPG
jgi:hypothetical protein